jgi:predicted nucleic acid-binding protein
MMKVFLDTNVFLEYFEQRRECQAVGKLLSAVEDGKLKAIVSVGCVYTLAYLIRMELKRKDIHRPEQTLRLRTMLNTVMSMVTVGGLNQSRIVKGLNDVAFDDVEDSFQYQCGLQAKCDALITINLRDYNNADTSKMEILSPTEFVEKYL